MIDSFIPINLFYFAVCFQTTIMGGVGCRADNFKKEGKAAVLGHKID